ncbi:MAG: M14 family metallopeptidase [Anaerolineae bacterium]
MPQVRFDKYYKYDELTTLLQAWAMEQPARFHLTSIGKSYQGRDIWLATVTNFATGPDTEKPALFIEANIHAVEVTGCTAALHLINKLLTQYGVDEKVTRVMDTRAFYIMPRLNPDGAELALADRPRFVRSSVRPYPRLDQQDGLIEEDIDGDGRILMMRVRDPNGAWKPYANDPRWLIAREPDDAPGGEYYRLLPEGSIQNYDGVTIKVAPVREGLDLNRQYPMEWMPEGDQHGAGPYPTSEPEVRAMVQAVIDRPNITGYITYHTMSGVHLRPYSAHPDDDFPTSDLRGYKFIGERATKFTGYPNKSVFHDFKYEPKQVIRGGSDDWMYDHLGVYAWTTEFWSPQQQIGLKDYHFIEWYRDHPLEHDLKLLKWNDDVLQRKGYVDWYPFDHPQLGHVELGGWDQMYSWTNPPTYLLEKEIAPHSDFAIFHLLISPQLDVHTLDVKPIGDGVYRVRLVLCNTGWLPTNITQKAVDRKAVRAIEVELTLPDGATLVNGEKKVEAGQLEGRSQKRNMLDTYADATSDRVKVEWVIAAPKGGTLKIEARHQRAGTLRREVELR